MFHPGCVREKVVSGDMWVSCSQKGGEGAGAVLEDAGVGASEQDLSCSSLGSLWNILSCSLIFHSCNESPFINKNMEAQRGQQSCPKPHSCNWLELALRLCSS